uniref:Uncharacterized protein n=1 Tax=Rhizophagus irregularis (strain DAOM 181602 / DAOM 197198 / MUCL 43194) TaxID=747089 RepID=U9T0J3_RHIID
MFHVNLLKNVIANLQSSYATSNRKFSSSRPSELYDVLSQSNWLYSQTSLLGSIKSYLLKKSCISHRFKEQELSTLSHVVGSYERTYATMTAYDEYNQKEQLFGVVTGS